jgi:ABC-type molybdate transport system substrate-binding protein
MTGTIRTISKQIAVAASLAFSLTCSAADLSILSAGATKSALGEIVESYQKISGNKINVEYAPVGGIMKRLSDGATG